MCSQSCENDSLLAIINDMHKNTRTHTHTLNGTLHPTRSFSYKCAFNIHNKKILKPSMPQHPIDINAYIHFAGFFHLGPREGEMGRFCKLTFHTLPHPFYFHSNSGLFLKRRSHSSVPWFFLWCHHVLFNEPAYTNPPTYISNSRLSHFTKSAFSNLYLTLRCAAHR